MSVSESSNYYFRIIIVLKFMAGKLKKKSKKVRKITRHSASGKISIDTATASVLEMHEEETSSSASSSGYRGSIESVSSSSTSIDSHVEQVELTENALLRMNISGECPMFEFTERAITLMTAPAIDMTLYCIY